MKPLRIQKLRDAAQDAPHCMACRTPNDGTVVGCHPNGLKYGKALSQKSHDLVAYLCMSCHDILDGRTPGLNRAERDEMFLNAFYWSVVWLIQDGKLGVK